MLYLHGLLGQVKGLVAENRFWMSWNLLLALVPAVLAVAVFRFRGRRGVAWWVGVAAFVLFLPNAPYVVTDLVHLPGDAGWVGSRGAVLVGVLPLYAAFVFVGLSAYVLALHEVDGFLHRIGRDRWRRRVEVSAHVVCSIGIVLGRVGRLNSWDTVTDPGATASRATETLSWSGTPLRLALVVATTWIGFLAVRAAWRAVEQVSGRLVAR